MVLCGGLELVAAGVIYNEYQKHKREKARLEEERDEALEQRYRRERERRRRLSSSSEKPRPRPTRRDSEEYKYGYEPQVSSGSGYSKPAAAVTGLYGATVGQQQSPYRYDDGRKHGSGGNASMLALPAPSMRPSSVPPVEASQFQFQNPPPYMMAQNPAYNPGMKPMEPRPYIPGQYVTPASPPVQQQQQHQAPPQQAFQQHSPYPLPPAGTTAQQYSPQPPAQSPGPYPSPYPSHDSKYPHSQYNPRLSDSSLPLGIYEPSTYSPDASEGRNNLVELSADRRHQQLPHVRFRLPNDRVVGTGSRSSVGVAPSPPPAYSYRG